MRAATRSVASLALVLAACNCREVTAGDSSGPGGDLRPLDTCEWSKPESCRLDAKTRIKWKLDLGCGACMASAPVIGKTGEIYLTTETTLYAVSADGQIRWKAALPINPEGGVRPPAVSPTGDIVLTTYKGAVVCYDPGGKLKWGFILDGPFYSGGIGLAQVTLPVISRSGDIFVAATDKKVYAIDAAGKLKWKRAFESYPAGDLTQNPTIPDGKLLVPMVGVPTLLALDLGSGETRWERSLAEHGKSIAGHVAAGGLYIVSMLTIDNASPRPLSGSVVGLRPVDGSVAWSARVDDGYVGRLLADPAGVVYGVGDNNVTGSQGGEMSIHALASKDGTLLYNDRLGLDRLAVSQLGPVGADGQLYATVGQATSTPGDRLISYSVRDRSVTEVHRFVEYAQGAAQPALLPDGTLILPWSTFLDRTGPVWTTSLDLYAIQTQSAGLARGGWPREGHDNQSSGDLSTPLP